MRRRIRRLAIDATTHHNPSRLTMHNRPATMLAMAPKIDPDRYVTIGTAAKLAGVSRLWMRKLVQGGHVAGVKIDTQWFALRSAVESFAETTPERGRPRGGKHAN